MKNKSDFIVALTIIYLALVFLVGIAVYAFIKYFCLDITLATNILSWSATMFATIALLYTYTNWREQESTKLLSALSNQCIDKIDVLVRTNEQLGSNIISILNGEKINSYGLYEDFKVQCSELHNLLLKINSGLNSNHNIELDSLIMEYIKKIENIKSIVNNTLNFFDNLEDDHKTSFRMQINSLAGSLFSNLNQIKKEIKPYLFFDKSA